MKPILILIANRFFLTNYAISCILRDLDGMRVAGVSEDKLIDEIRRQNPDMIIVETDMIKQDSIRLLKEIKRKFPRLKIISLVDSSDMFRLKNLLDLGLDGYLSKSVTKEELQRAALRVYNNEKYFSQEISGKIFDYKFKNSVNKNLSKREQEILQYIAEGMNNKEIGGLLNISEFTVLTHRRNIMRKLNVKNTPQLIIESIKRGLISIGDN
ncbi:LuxR C-terminal-related transcriptional regulator [Melioribacter sp. Ez-97]|uniref:response regulator transcription factor n=1 Tax=Melioribacter sp. Ez-97 TaxID=3423434 RepID=UPI003ED9F206